MSIRVSIVQPALPNYRIPVFRELAARPDIEPTLFFGEDRQSLGVSNATADGFEAHGCRIRTFGPASQPLYWCQESLRQASQSRSNVLILPWNVRYLSLLPAVLRARAAGVGTVLWGHGYSKSDSGFRWWLRSKVAATGDALLFYNRSTSQRFLDAGWSPARIHVAQNTIDAAPIRAARQPWLERPETLDTFRTNHGLPGPTLIFVSRLESANRVDLLLRAAAKLAPEFPGLRTVIIGKGDAETSELKRLATSLGIADEVIFPGPIYHEPDLAPWMLIADVFCYPANIGLSLNHAFAHGLPVVTSDRISAQNPEIEALIHGHNGLLYPDGDPAALTQALAGLLSNPASLAKMSDAAAKTADDGLSLSRMVDGFESAIRHAARR